jgi:pimeloyl-ACP methyl ester carboxylesterase
MIDYVESGAGEPVLFIPGSYSTAAAWRPIQKLLPPRWRFIGTSLCGYGQTQETRTPDDTALAHELRVVEHAARRAGAGPVHLVGHSFGATVALACARSGAVQVASLALFEANPIALLRDGPHQALFDDILRVSRDFEAAVRSGERDAPARIIDFWGGAGAFAAMPPAVQEYCRATAPANVLDWRGAFGFEFSEADCAELDVPVLLVRGALANAAMVAMTDSIAAHLPRAQPAVVAGANHFLVSTHAAACAELLSAFL